MYPLPTEQFENMIAATQNELLVALCAASYSRLVLCGPKPQMIASYLTVKGEVRVLT